LNKTTAAAALAFAFSLGAGVGAVGPALHEQPQPTPTSTVLPDGPQFIGGVMRLYADGPKWHADADHWISGIDPTVDPVIDSSGFITFHTLEKNAILSCEANPDETLVARDITAGCSNGSYLVRLRVAKAGVPLNMDDPDDYALAQGSYANFWVDIEQDGSWTP
jgi:hypothetical protein